MIRVLAAGFGLVLAALPALADDGKVSTAIKAFEQVASDDAKLKAYCAMTKLADEIGDDEKKALAAEAQMDGYIKILGPGIDAAMATAETLDDAAPEFKALDATIKTLDQKCPK